jgi:alkane 1-monooxygenase
LFFTFFWGFFTGVNAIGGHELLHKKEFFNKWAGNWCYAKFMYSHYMDDHILGHHKNVATPKDPASAIRGENIYQFVKRSSFGTFSVSWNREFKRIEKKFGTKTTLLHKFAYNKMSYYAIFNIALLTSIYLILGPTSLMYQMIYMFWGAWYLEVINYIEHYGLLRKKDENGIYESINKMHSWNSLSTHGLFRL